MMSITDLIYISVGICRAVVLLHFSPPKMARKLPPLYTTRQKLSTHPSQANPTQPNTEKDTRVSNKRKKN